MFVLLTTTKLKRLTTNYRIISDDNSYNNNGIKILNE